MGSIFSDNRSRVPVKESSILKLQFFMTGFIWMIVKIDDLFDELLRILGPVHDEFDLLFIVAIVNDMLRNLPQINTSLVLNDLVSFFVNYQNAIYCSVYLSFEEGCFPS